MEEIVRKIRNELRRGMNGIASDAMRRSGIVYKLNFGVSLPDIKKIATHYESDQALAEFLWEQDVRELKILATLLYPHTLFTPEKAQHWVSGVRHQEIAEQLVANLLVHIPRMDEVAIPWFTQTGEYRQVVAFLLAARFFALQIRPDARFVDTFLTRAKEVMDGGISREQRTAVQALKRYGRGNEEHARQVLELLREYPFSGSPEKEEFYEDIKFEFDSYL